MIWDSNLKEIKTPVHRIHEKKCLLQYCCIGKNKK